MSKKKPSVSMFEYKPELKKALVVVAHPDDIDFGCAGTVATLTAHGVEVVYCLVTSGDAGGDASTHTKEERAAIRESEQTNAARVVGVQTLEFLHYADGTVEPTLQLRKDISRVIRKHQPDLVITQSPERNWERIYGSHPDHMAAGEATVRAVYPDARNPHAFPELLQEGFQPHTVPELWITGLNPTMAVDITEQFDKKIEALRQHESQVGHREDLRALIKDWAKRTSKSFGLPKGTLVEAFKVVNTK